MRSEQPMPAACDTGVVSGSAMCRTRRRGGAHHNAQDAQTFATCDELIEHCCGRRCVGCGRWLAEKDALRRAWRRGGKASVPEPEPGGRRVAGWVGVAPASCLPWPRARRLVDLLFENAPRWSAGRNSESPRERSGRAKAHGGQALVDPRGADSARGLYGWRKMEEDAAAPYILQLTARNLCSRLRTGVSRGSRAHSVRGISGPEDLGPRGPRTWAARGRGLSGTTVASSFSATEWLEWWCWPGTEGLSHSPNSVLLFRNFRRRDTAAWRSVGKAWQVSRCMQGGPALGVLKLIERL